MKIKKSIVGFVDSNEVARFVIVGAGSVLSQYLVYWLLMKIVGLPYNFSYVVGFIVCVVLNFFGSSIFTFKVKPTMARATKYLFGHGVNFVVQMVVFNLANMCGVDPRLSPLIAFTVAFPINFVLIRFAFKGELREMVRARRQRG